MTRLRTVNRRATRAARARRRWNRLMVSIAVLARIGRRNARLAAELGVRLMPGPVDL